MEILFLLGAAVVVVFIFIGAFGVFFEILTFIVQAITGLVAALLNPLFLGLIAVLAVIFILSCALGRR
jgi:hypothetical protein